MTPGAPILIAACGNPMAADDGFGPAVAERLASRDLPEVSVLNLTTRPDVLLEHLGNRAALLVIDAVTGAGEDPSDRWVDLSWREAMAAGLQTAGSLSSHGWSVGSVIEMARRLKMLPPVVHLIGIRIDRDHVGEAMSGEVATSVEAAADRAEAWSRCLLEKAESRPHA